MEAEELVPTSLNHLTAADAERRIGDWLGRGYVMFSDIHTRSTHLRRADPGIGRPTTGGGPAPGRRRPRAERP